MDRSVGFKAIRLRTKGAMMPRRVYLLQSVSDAKTLFKNCFILKDLAWWTIPGIANQLASNEHVVNSKLPLEEYLSSYFNITTVPFNTVPVPKGDGSRKPERNVFAGLLKHKANRGHTADLGKVARLFLDNASSISVILGGEVYRDPCNLCRDYFKSVHGECTFVNERKKTCHFSLVFKSDLKQKTYSGNLSKSEEEEIDKLINSTII